MKQIKSKNIIFTFSMVALLILSSIGSFGISFESKDIDRNIEKNSSCRDSAFRIKTHSKSAIASFIPTNSGKIQNLGDSNFNDKDNIVVANTTNNESYPSIVSRGLNYLIAYETEENNDPYIYFRQSDDYGDDWLKKPKTKLEVKVSPTEEISINSPRLCIIPDSNHAYGTFLSKYNNSAIHHVFEISDISGDLTNPTIFYWDLSYIDGDEGNGSFWGFKDIEIKYHSYTNVPWITSFIGSTNYTNETGEGPSNNTIMFMFQDYRDPAWWIQWNPFYGNCSNLSINMNDDYTQLYGICEIMNGPNIGLLYFTCFYEIDQEDPDKNPFLNLTYQNFTGPGNLTHPHIFVKGNHIYIAAETDANGCNEIILFHSPNGGSTWNERTVVANQSPVADFSWSADRLDVTFTDNSSDDDGYITSWYWDFGDGNTSTEQDPHHQYGMPGVYKVNLTIRDDDNATNISSITVTVDNTTPIANFTYSPLKPAKFEDISFIDTSIPYGVYTNDNWTWDFGDGYTSDEQNPTHNYTENGTYIVSLKVKNETINKPDSIVKVIKVGLVADFGYEPQYSTIDDLIWFNDSSSDSHEREIKNWTWNFDDGSAPIEMQNTTHKYLRPGVYLVNLTIKNDLNSTTTVLKQIVVRPSQMMPRYPRLFTNETLLSCIFVESGNLLITNSSDNGKNWYNPIQLNSLNGSVVEEYRFSDMPDIDHVVWTDNRDGNNDIYSIILATPEMDLMIIPDSVKLARDDTFYFFETHNWIEFTVLNNGRVPVEYVPIAIEYIRTNQDPEPTEHPEFIRYLEAKYELPFRTPLFRINVREFINALINFAGIEYINITVDPGNTIGDINRSNNVYTLTDVTYGKIFPVIGRLLGIP